MTYNSPDAAQGTGILRWIAIPFQNSLFAKDVGVVKKFKHLTDDLSAIVMMNTILLKR